MADDDAEGGDDERAIELSSVAAIYPELAIDSSDPFSATIDIPVEPIEPLAIRFPTSVSQEIRLPTPPPSNGVSQATVEVARQEIQKLAHLPPLILSISLPEGYPSQTAPCFRLVAEPRWLPEWRLQELKDSGSTIWEDMGRDQVVFAYIDHLREVADNGFGLVKEDGEYLEVSNDLKLALLDFDLKAKRAKFEAGTYECGICLEPKKGSKCHRFLLCGHVFCVECLQDFFNSCITEGDVGSVKCVAPKCGEDQPQPKRQDEDRTLDPSELLQIPLSQEQVQRYITLKRKKKYESDPTTVWCPRKWCQGPARTAATEAAADKSPSDIKQSNTGTKAWNLPPADRLAICEDCNFAFCQVCKASWHGEFKYCTSRNPGEVSAEEKASEEYIKLHSTPCPTCTAPCQKSLGCNHMICFKCKSHFCYLCSSWLEQGNPYRHFNNPKNGCYMRLWELEGGDGGDVGIGFGGQGDLGDPFFDDDDTDTDTDTDFSESESESDDDDDDGIIPPAPDPGRGRGGARGGRGRGGRGARGGGRGRGNNRGAPPRPR